MGNDNLIADYLKSRPRFYRDGSDTFTGKDVNGRKSNLYYFLGYDSSDGSYTSSLGTGFTNSVAPYFPSVSALDLISDYRRKGVKPLICISKDYIDTHYGGDLERYLTAVGNRV